MCHCFTTDAEEIAYNSWCLFVFCWNRDTILHKRFTLLLTKHSQDMYDDQKGTWYNSFIVIFLQFVGTKTMLYYWEGYVPTRSISCPLTPSHIAFPAVMVMATWKLPVVVLVFKDCNKLWRTRDEESLAGFSYHSSPRDPRNRENENS